MPSEPSADIGVVALERLWRIPAVPASTWLRAFDDDPETLLGLFPGLVDPDDLDDMLLRLIEIPDSQTRCRRAARILLQRGSGMEWVVAWNLMRMSRGVWLWINGALVRQGVRAGTETLADWLDAAYVLLYEGKDEKGRMAFETELTMPPKGEHLAVSAAAQRRAAMAFAAD